MTAAVLLFPHQLFADSPLLQLGLPVWLVEEPLFFTQYAFHRQKLVYHRATLLHYRQWLEAQGLTVHYLRHDEPAADCRKLPQCLRKQGITALHCHDLVDDWLQRRLQRACVEAGVTLKLVNSPQFINDATSLAAEFLPKRKRFLLQAFYQRQRQSRQILLEGDGSPRGGQWSFDADNRLRYPARQQPPSVQLPPLTPLLETARAQIMAEFPHNPGALDGPLRYPLTHEQAVTWLHDFLDWRFAGFGSYEDAIVADAHVLHHSVLTPMLNNGLLTPQQVLDATLKYAAAANIPLNSVEGFVRQVLGWREYVRGIYWTHMPDYLELNTSNAQAALPDFYWSGHTDMACLRDAILQTLNHGYAHHIQRLMVTGLYALLLGVAPKQVHAWYLGVYVDAVEWVELPNTLGMSQFADGGLMASKPYVASGKYIDRMSNHCKGCKFNPAESTGDTACPFTTLYWDYLNTHSNTLAKNPRMLMQLKNLNRLTDENKKLISEQALKHRSSVSVMAAAGQQS